METITFERKDIFGKGFSKAKGLDDCNVIAILEHLHLNGKIKLPNNLDTKQLWLYIYYLWSHNKEHPALQKMGDINQRAIANYFVHVIKQYLEKHSIPTFSDQILSKSSLETFINLLIEESEEDGLSLNIPAINRIITLVIDSLKKEDDENEHMYKQLEANMQFIRDEHERLQQKKLNVQAKIQVDDQEFPPEAVKASELTVKFLTRNSGLTNNSSKTYIRL